MTTALAPIRTPSSTMTGVAEAGSTDARQHRAGADVAARTHRGPTAQDGSHVNHGARAHDGANINHRAHHDDRALHFHLFPDDGTGFNAGWNLRISSNGTPELRRSFSTT